jgi:hypothetical protein
LKGGHLDPQVTWQIICDALQRLDYAIEDGEDDEEARDAAASALEDLARWIRSGGMPPTVD